MTIDKIFKTTASHFGIPLEVLYDHKNRHSKVVHARHVASFIAHNVAFISYRQIGLALGNTHATARYGCIQIEKIEKQEGFKKDLAAITLALQ